MVLTLVDRLARRNPSYVRCRSGGKRGAREGAWIGGRLMSYAPTPGTHVYRAIEYLRTLPAGAEAMASRIAEAIDAPVKVIQPCMLPALTAGLVFARQKDDHKRAPLWYSLTDHSKIPRAPVQRVAIPQTPPEGANRAASAGQSHVAEASESATGRGAAGPTALGVAPVSSSSLVDVALVLRVTPRQAEQFARMAREGAWA